MCCLCFWYLWCHIYKKQRWRNWLFSCSVYRCCVNKGQSWSSLWWKCTAPSLVFFFPNGFQKDGLLLLSRRNKQSSSDDERPCTLVITQNVQSASSSSEWRKETSVIFRNQIPFCPKSSCWASQSSLLLLSLVMVYGGSRYWSQNHQSVWLTVCFIMMRSLNSIQVQLAVAPQSDVRVQLRQLGLSWDSATYSRGETRGQSTWHSITTTPKPPLWPQLVPICSSN